MNINPFSSASSPAPKKGPSALDKAVGDDVVGSGGGDTFQMGEAAAFTGGGAAIGAGIGAGIAYANASGKVNAVPVQTVTENWKEPVTTDKNIGDIPHNQYFPASHWGSILGTSGGVFDEMDRPNVNPDLRPTDPTIRPVPNLTAQGDPIFRDVTQTFSGHGQPILATTSHVVTTPTLGSPAFNQSITDDSHYETRDTGHEDYSYSTDSNGVQHRVDNGPETTQVRVLDGVRADFSPNVKDVPVNSAHNTYETKNVTFNSGVDVGGIVLKGALYGALGGAAVGLIADVAKQELGGRYSIS
jgi:hypothetical protein